MIVDIQSFKHVCTRRKNWWSGCKGSKSIAYLYAIHTWLKLTRSFPTQGDPMTSWMESACYNTRGVQECRLIYDLWTLICSVCSHWTKILRKHMRAQCVRVFEGHLCYVSSKSSNLRTHDEQENAGGWLHGYMVYGIWQNIEWCWSCHDVPRRIVDPNQLIDRDKWLIVYMTSVDTCLETL